MSLRLRRGTNAERLSATIDSGELVYVTDTNKLYIGDGQSPNHGVNILSTSAGIGLSWNDTTQKIDLSSATMTTANIAEFGNLYFTAERAQDAISTLFSHNSHNGITFQYDDLNNKINATVVPLLPSNSVGFLYNTGNGTLSWNTTNFALQNIAEDTTPMLGGSLNLNGNDIIGYGDITITGKIELDGTVQGNIIPNISSVYTLGNINYRLSQAYINTVYIGNENISNDGGLTISSVTNPNVYINNVGPAPASLRLRKAKGAVGDLQTVAVNDTIYEIKWDAYTTDNGYLPVAGIVAKVTNPPTTTVVPTKLDFYTTDIDGSNTVKVSILSNGRLSVINGLTTHGLTLEYDTLSANNVSGFVRINGKLSVSQDIVVLGDIQDAFGRSLISTPLTNHFYVNPQMPGTYTPDGSIQKPFLTIADAQFAATQLIVDEVIAPSEGNPIFIVLQGNVVEDVILDHGHIFLIGQYGGIHAPIYIYGTITINGSDTTVNSYELNQFSIQGVSVVSPDQHASIYFTGANPQQLMLKDVWLSASGNQTGTVPFTDAGGYSIYSDNTGIRLSDNTRSTIHGSDIKFSHSGAGDVYCINMLHGVCELSHVETSNITQFGAVKSGAALTLQNSTIIGNGESVIEAYGTGVLTLTSCLLVNTQPNSNGIKLNSGTSTVIIGNCTFNIPAGSGKAVYNITSGGALFHSGSMFMPNSNNKITSTILATELVTIFDNT